MGRHAAMRCKPKAKRSTPLLLLKVQTSIHPESRPIEHSVTCRQFKVTGRVQGVFFRVSARDVAVPLQISGHAVNRQDGSVEVLACGEAAAVAELERWLHDGPPLASVTRVECLDVDCEKPERFSVG
jgi:acylphosphatase